MCDSYQKTISKLGIEPSAMRLLVSIPDQRMYLYEGSRRVKTYVVSTSRNPPCCKKDSLGTPWGLHKISEVIGVGVEAGMVFKGRVATGKRFWECSPEERQANLITSRILRLDGMEEGINLGGELDTRNRYVYIHGTNREWDLGIPSSSGCVQMRNDEIIDLAELVSVWSHVYINV